METTTLLILIIGWSIHLITSFYLIRPIHYRFYRFLLTLLPCVLLTYFGTHDLPQLDMTSTIIVTFSWLVSIRFMDLVVFSPNKTVTFDSFLWRFFVIFVPIIPTQSVQYQWPILFDVISASIKVTLNHWIYRWILTCKSSDSYQRIIMHYISVLTFSYISDIQIALVRIITRDRHTLLSFTNFPFLSKSLREFWNRRYNQLVSSVLRESVFQPIRLYLSSATIAALIAFTISGLLHVHLARVAFNDTRYTVSTFIFFFLHGLACCLEANLPIRLPPYLGWLVTHIFLLVTAPLAVGPYINTHEFFIRHVPPLFDSKWIPKLPTPNYCPK